MIFYSFPDIIKVDISGSDAALMLLRIWLYIETPSETLKKKALL